MRDTVKVSVNLPGEVIDALKAMATKHTTTMTEIMRRAVLMEKYLEDARDRGERILLEGDGYTKELVFRL